MTDLLTKGLLTLSKYNLRLRKLLVIVLEPNHLLLLLLRYYVKYS